MTRAYTQKDLGYPRVPTTAKLRVAFDNGREVWDVSAQVVADDRDDNYRYDKEDTTGFIRKGLLDNYELTDWAANNMNWSNLAPYAERVVLPPKKIDYEDEWCTAEMKIVGNI